MDVRETLVELIDRAHHNASCVIGHDGSEGEAIEEEVRYLIAYGVTVQEEAYWQYDEDDIDSDNNIQAYCSKCFAGDKHAVGMIGKVPFCWKCRSRMMPQPPKGE